MTIYLYDDATRNYIGELKTAWVREQIPPGTLIIYQQIKYIVVTSEAKSQPYTFVVTVNPA
jgi:hypothetical protein